MFSTQAREARALAFQRMREDQDRFWKSIYGIKPPPSGTHLSPLHPNFCTPCGGHDKTLRDENGLCVVKGCGHIHV